MFPNGPIIILQGIAHQFSEVPDIFFGIAGSKNGSPL